MGPTLKIYEAGWQNPYRLHAIYTGLANSLRDNDTPWFITVRSDRGHIALGASQYADAELDLACCRARNIPVIQRPLGGGTVWVDQYQLCLFLIFPKAYSPRSHAALFDHCLELLREAYKEIGLQVERKGGQDLWCKDRKILGSGAATIGQSMVFGASILESFDVKNFVSCLNMPSLDFKSWLETAITENMADLRFFGINGSTYFISALRKACQTIWVPQKASPDTQQCEAIVNAEHELREPLDTDGKRMVSGGIKVRHGTYLLEDPSDPAIRVLLSNGRVVRAACTDKTIGKILRLCIDHHVDALSLECQARKQGLSKDKVELVIARLKHLCRGLECSL